MSVPQGVEHEPIAQANIGLYPGFGVQPKFSPLGPLSFGFLWGDIWVVCGITSAASWTGCGITSAIGWSGCGITSIASWSECL